MELTDLEICKLITILELKEKFPDAKEIGFDKTQNCFWVKLVGFTGWPLLDPLTDDALCFKLMVKYKVRMHWLWEENGGTPHYEAYINEDSSDIKYDKLPNKAILLCIIESHKES